MSAAATLERGRAREPAADDVAAASRQAAGKRSLAADSAPQAPAAPDQDAGEELEAEEDGAGEAGAGDWEMTAGLSAAMGLDAEAGEAGEAEAAPGAPVRRKAAASSWANEAPAGDDQAIARAGFTGSPAADFPHRGAIEQSFGAPLPATAYTGGAAAQASSALGADGYALGSQVGFASAAPSLELAAHEAAHVMQATTGVQLHGGSGAHEDHADAVAARVVRGESAADLLTGGPAPVAASAPVVHLQRRKRGGGEQSKKRGKGRNKDHTKRIDHGQRTREPKRDGGQLSAEQLIDSLRKLIERAQWKNLRPAAYARGSAKAQERIEQRELGEEPELTGLGKIAEMTTFAQAIKELKGGWKKLDLQRRADQINDAVNQALHRAHVVMLQPPSIEKLAEQGALEPAMWRMVMNQQLLEQKKLDDDQAAQLCNTALHEARHAEQHYLAARFHAGRRLSKYPDEDEQEEVARKLVEKLKIPLSVARFAIADRFKDDTNEAVAALGKQMYEAHGSNNLQNQRISDEDRQKEMEGARQEALTALADLEERASSRHVQAASFARAKLRTAIAEVLRRYAEYRDIPYEADAHEVGDSVERIFRKLPGSSDSESDSEGSSLI